MPSIKTIAALAAVIFSCNADQYDFTELNSSTNEVLVDSYFEDLEDMTATVIAAEPGTQNGNRMVVLPVLDQRLSCAGVIDLRFSDDNSAAVPHGVINIIFVTGGCTDAKGNVRNGRIVIEFKGRRFLPGSTVTTTTQEYTINKVSLEGKRTTTYLAGSTEDHPIYRIEMNSGTATFPDGTKANRITDFTREWFRNANPVLDQWKVTGTAQGLGRYSLFDMTIIEPILYRRDCALGLKVFMAVQGKKKFTVKGSEYILDYGDGSCDKAVTATVGRHNKSFDMEGNF